MAQNISLTDQENPIAQTFRVLEKGGSVITKIGVFFASAPKSTQTQHPIFLELRPVTDGGNPSSTQYWASTKTKATASQIRSVASTSFSSGTEYKFTLKSPLYVPENTEIAFVLYSAAPAGRYRVWGGSLGDFEYGSTVKRITHQLDAGVLFQSANGTAWSADQTTDLAFKVYRAEFAYQTVKAVLHVDQPPKKRLTENIYTNKITSYPTNPLRMTAGSKDISVVHPAHGFQIGDHVVLETFGNGFDSADTVNGISGANILGRRVITAVDPFGYTFTAGGATNATTTASKGGSKMRATEQYMLDEMRLDLYLDTPPNTSAYIDGSFTTSKGFAGNETAYSTIENVPINLASVVRFKDPVVVASKSNEDLRLSGNPSTTFNVYLTTNNKYVAPHFNTHNDHLGSTSFLIDYQDSADFTNFNEISTIPFVSEEEPDGGTTAFKHITVPFVLENAAASIRVLIEAVRPEGSDFDVWYRTANSSASTPISRKRWTKFSKSKSSPNTSNYYEVGTVDDYSKSREYEFNVYDINAFDTYQIKVTFNSRRQTQPPVMMSLRTIATAAVT